MVIKEREDQSSTELTKQVIGVEKLVGQEGFVRFGRRVLASQRLLKDIGTTMESQMFAYSS